VARVTERHDKIRAIKSRINHMVNEREEKGAWMCCYSIGQSYEKYSNGTLSQTKKMPQNTSTQAM
jgi:hypothetical protein